MSTRFLKLLKTGIFDCYKMVTGQDLRNPSETATIYLSRAVSWNIPKSGVIHMHSVTTSTICLLP
jgi:hypothetical protein